MCPRDMIVPRELNEKENIPFRDAEEAWFWFMAAQQARLEGARFVAGAALMPRPCEPLDILKTLDRLVRQRRVLRDHLLVLRHYGRRFMPPDPRRIKEHRAHTLWRDALEKLQTALEEKGIVRSAQTNLWSAQERRHFLNPNQEETFV